ncbi:FxsA family protein [Staphylococcus chromogenes]|nr:FxsA family protein [Staphylococcus chromogenes]
MPVVIFLAYLFLEAFMFWAVSQAIGVGWAFLVLFLLMFGGIIVAGIEMKQVARAALERRQSPGRSAVDYGLITAGSIGLAIPGFLTSLLGLILIVPPTRALVRNALARKAKKWIEQLGMRGFEAAGKYRPRTSYGSFRDDSRVIDAREMPSEEDISTWSEKLDPKDFTDPGKH